MNDQPHPGTNFISLFLSRLPEQGMHVVYDALVGVVIGVGEEDVPVRGERVGVHSEAVVLTGDEAAICSVVDAGLVVASVTVPERRTSGVRCHGSCSHHD